jgi:hypothetical protein
MKVCVVQLILIISFFAAQSADYFPLSVNNYWIYSLQDTNGLEVGFDSIVLVESNYYGGYTFYRKKEYMFDLQMNLTDSNVGIFTQNDLVSDDSNIYLGSFDDTLAFENPVISGCPYLKHNYSPGESWDPSCKQIDSFVVEFVGTTTVPAGTFDSCYYIKFKNVENAGYVFAPDVGAIKILALANSILVRYNTISADIKFNKKGVSILKLYVYPNPFKYRIQFKLLSNLNNVHVYDTRGARIKNLSRKQTYWDGKDNYGTRMSPGVYILSLEHDKGITTRKVTLIR